MNKHNEQHCNNLTHEMYSLKRNKWWFVAHRDGFATVLTKPSLCSTQQQISHLLFQWSTTTQHKLHTRSKCFWLIPVFWQSDHSINEHHVSDGNKDLWLNTFPLPMHAIQQHTSCKLSFHLVTHHRSLLLWGPLVLVDTIFVAQNQLITCLMWWVGWNLKVSSITACKYFMFFVFS